VNFDSNVVYTAQNLVAGRRYLFEVLYVQNTGSAILGLGARRAGTPGNIPISPCSAGVSSQLLSIQTLAQ
jgi:hypothetical protein